MSGVIDKLRKRKCFPVQIYDETVHIRGMRDSEHAEVDALGNDPDSRGYAVGCCLLNEDGSQAMTRLPNESPKDFGRRTLATIDMTDDVLLLLVEAIIKLATTRPTIETLAKN